MTLDLGKIYAESILEQLQQEVAALNHFARSRRLGHSGEVSPVAAAAHSDFARRWKALIDEGFEKGLLEEDYEGLHLTEPEREWIWDETEEEHQARLKRENCDVSSGGHVVFTTVQRGPSR